MRKDVKERLVNQIIQMDFEQIILKDSSTSCVYTYEHFFSKCYGINKFLKSKYEQENIVAILENGTLLIQLYFIALLSKRTIFVIDPQKSTAEIADIIKTIPSGLLIKEENVVVSDEKLIDISSDISMMNNQEILRECDIKTWVIERVMERDFGDCYLVTYTSGTTGTAKGVRHSANSLFGAAYALQKKVQAPKGDKFLHVMPMTYMAGVLNSIFYPFIAELEIVVEQRFSVRVAIKFWSIVKENEITVFWLSPTMLMMLEQVDRKHAGEEYCKEHNMFFMIGTAALTDTLRTTFESRYKVKLLASYGLSETLFISIETNKSKLLMKENNVGELLDGVEYIIKDDELYLKVPWMFLGYTNTNTEEYFFEDYYKSGDLVEVWDNILRITGRKKDLIVRGGMNLSPAQIEKVVTQDVRIIECAVIATKNKFCEEQVCCVYVPQNDVNEEIEAALNQNVIEKLGKNYRVDIFYKVQSLPRNINGKVDKEKIRLMYGE